RPQAAGLHRPLRLVAQVLPAPARSIRQHAAQGEGALRDRPPHDHRRPLAGRLREGSVPGRGQAAAPEGERGAAAEVEGLMDKIYASPAEAIADLADGARVAVSGFGQSAGSPVSLLAA